MTETLGKLRLVGKAKQVDKMKMMEQMIQEEMALRLPQNLNAYLMVFCLGMGYYALKGDFKHYYGKLSRIDYRESQTLMPYFKRAETNLPWSTLFRYIN